MNIGQISYRKIAPKSSHVLLNICGMKEQEATQYALLHKTKPFILHGDWNKQGCHENNFLKNDRRSEYVDVIRALQAQYELKGFCLHPVYRTKSSLSDFLSLKEQFEEEAGIPIFVENRSHQGILLSRPTEIIHTSHHHQMTIDIPQLFISCGYDENLTLQTLKQLCWSNVKEIHLANVCRLDGRTYVGRRLSDPNGLLDIPKYVPFLKQVEHITLEILGGVRVFEEERTFLESVVRSFE